MTPLATIGPAGVAGSPSRYKATGPKPSWRWWSDPCPSDRADPLRADNCGIGGFFVKGPTEFKYGSISSIWWCLDLFPGYVQKDVGRFPLNRKELETWVLPNM